MTKEIKVALLDFDGTLVTKDILDLLCGIVGKEKESERINQAFNSGKLPGLTALVSRINFLAGITKSEIAKALKPNSFLMPGAEELMHFFRQNEIITILASGNILPVLEYYQQLLGITHIVGSEPDMDGDVLVSISEKKFSSPSFKIDGIKKILKGLQIKKDNIVALGDSPADKNMFEMSSYSIAVNPKGDIAEYADAVVEDDLNTAVLLLRLWTQGDSNP